MHFWMWKRFIAVATAALALALCVFGLRIVSVFRFSNLDGEHTYYLDSTSSQALQKQTLTIFDCLRVRGESVRFFCDDENVAQTLAKMYDAKIVHVETVDGVTSYYGYTQQWLGGVCVQGQKVNLHIAVRGNTCVVGSPVIFGGF